MSIQENFDKPRYVTWVKKRKPHFYCKNDSLIWNKIRAQLQDSAHPTHSVTLMGGGERKIQPVRSQSARPKNRRGTKTWNAKPTDYWQMCPRHPPSFRPTSQGQVCLLPPRALLPLTTSAAPSSVPRSLTLIPGAGVASARSGGAAGHVCDTERDWSTECIVIN